MVCLLKTIGVTIVQTHSPTVTSATQHIASNATKDTTMMLITIHVLNVKFMAVKFVSLDKFASNAKTVSISIISLQIIKPSQ